jgi:TRAP-type C4-dicarboxylate transport system substrate-binding protein
MEYRIRSVLVALTGVVALAAGAPESATARELVYSSSVPAKHPVHATGLEPFFKRVEEATGGSLTFKLFPGGTLASGKTTLNAISNGTADMGLLADVYTPGDLSTSALTSDLAVLGKDARVMTGAVNQTLLIDCEPCKQDYLKHKVLPLASYSLTPYYLMCTGAPVNVTSAEIYEALQRGQADCALGPVPWLKSYTLWDLVKSVTDRPVGTYHGTNFINIRTDTWKKLSAKEKKAVRENLARATREMAEVYEKDDAEIRKESQAKGVQWVEPAAAFGEAVEKFRENDTKRVIELAASRGVKNPEPIVDQFTKNVEKWTAIVAEIGDGTWGPEQWDRYQAALQREVFDKVQDK